MNTAFCSVECRQTGRLAVIEKNEWVTRSCAVCVWVAGSHVGVHEINHNDDYEWYYSSLRVVDGAQSLYRDAAAAADQLTPGDVDVKMARCCSRRPEDVTGFSEPCE